jgi:hypothetical protein
MHPSMLGGFDLKSQRPEPFQFALEIGQRYLEYNVVNGRSCSIRPAITGAYLSGRTTRGLEG